MSIGEFFINTLTIFINSIREIMTTTNAILYAIYGMFIFSEILIFSSFIWAYLHIRWSNMNVISEFNLEVYSQITDLLNIGSALISIVAHRVQEADFYELDFIMDKLLLIGIMFLSYQGDEYSLLLTHINDNWMALFFYILTGLHSAHVCVGIIMTLIHSYFYEENGSFKDEEFNIGIYWHFVEIIWVGLTFLLFLN